MDEHYITGSEFFILVLLGALLPWLVATIIQTRIYIKRGLSKWKVLGSSIITLVLSSILGVVLWSKVPILTVAWQRFIFQIPNEFIKNLSFIPVGPMVTSTLLVVIPVTLLFLKRHKNA